MSAESGEVVCLVFFLVFIIGLSIVIYKVKDDRRRRAEIIVEHGLWIRLFNIFLPYVLALVLLVVGFATFRIREATESGPVHYETMIAFIILYITAFLVLLWNIFTGYQITFQLENMIIWSSFTVGWGSADGSLWEDLTGVMLITWAVSALIGAFLFLVGSKTRNFLRNRRYDKIGVKEGGYAYDLKPRIKE